MTRIYFFNHYVRVVLIIIFDVVQIKRIDTNCIDILVPPEPKDQGDPCIPSPCGPNAVCQNANGQPSCSCLPTYIGIPPSCRPECLINPDCPPEKSCINMKCKDPCPGSCGDNAECKVVNHAVTCSCKIGYTGNPFVQCVLEGTFTLILISIKKASTF